ncbi:PREDICTED: uncharacterized protein LOC104744123 [Camelina sativa]|uniref:Uncharacterized protein LOC104744123 n=1 Tax=Camelina sativa TaxID=90675 RepID=A0ABM0VZ52_CAMSA|nr:PREDICTED: uncharacterized protein LOC104744123 [Camelina sativa]
MADGEETGVHQPNPRLGIIQQQQRLFANRSAIQPPAPVRQDYEIKHSLINLVQNRVFHGLPSESPLDHIEAFERLTSTTRSNGVPYDYLMLTLFQFSLADKALRWLNLLDPGSLTTWAQCRVAFLNHFYTKSRSAKLQSKITTFSQGGMETFCEAWERFKEYLRDCAHHGYTQENLMNIFYGGIEQKYQMALDTASKGDFSTNTANKANALIENLAASNSNHGTDYDRTVRVNAVKTDAIKDLTAKAGGYADFGAETYLEGTEEMNYIGGQGNYQNRGFIQNFRNHPNLSYRSNNVENPQDKVYPPRPQQSNFAQGFQNKGTSFGGSNFQQKPQVNNFPQGYQATAPQAATLQESKLEQMMHALMENQKKNATEVTVKIDSMYSELNGRIESLNSHMRVLENQVEQSAARVKAPPGTLRSGRELTEQQQKEGIDRSNNKTGQSKTQNQENNPDEVPNQASDDIKIPGSATPGGEQPCKPHQPYVPKLPFPMRRKSKIQEREYEKLKSVVGELQVRLPFIEAVRMVPSLKKYMKEILTDKLSLEKGVMYLTQECSSMLQNRMPEKCGDPRPFTLPCTIGDLKFNKCLCDLGASVSLMPLSVATRLGLYTFKPTQVTLVLADRSTRRPEGVLENLPVQIGNRYIRRPEGVLENLPVQIGNC